jgi:hypothetical protein
MAQYDYSDTSILLWRLRIIDKNNRETMISRQERDNLQFERVFEIYELRELISERFYRSHPFYDIDPNPLHELVEGGQRG